MFAPQQIAALISFRRRDVPNAAALLDVLVGLEVASPVDGFDESHIALRLYAEARREAAELNRREAELRDSVLAGEGLAGRAMFERFSDLASPALTRRAPLG